MIILRRILTMLAGLAIICVLMGFVISSSRTDTPQHFSQLRTGMTPNQVIKIIGLPGTPGTTGGPADPHGTIFLYSSGTVHFTNDVVDKLSPDGT